MPFVGSKGVTVQDLTHLLDTLGTFIGGCSTLQIGVIIKGWSGKGFPSTVKTFTWRGPTAPRPAHIPEHIG